MSSRFEPTGSEPVYEGGFFDVRPGASLVIR